jgi:hypothetical protein
MDLNYLYHFGHDIVPSPPRGRLSGLLRTPHQACSTTKTAPIFYSKWEWGSLQDAILLSYPNAGLTLVLRVYRVTHRGVL